MTNKVYQVNYTVIIPSSDDLPYGPSSEEPKISRPLFGQVYGRDINDASQRIREGLMAQLDNLPYSPSSEPLQNPEDLWNATIKSRNGKKRQILKAGNWLIDEKGSLEEKTR